MQSFHQFSSQSSSTQERQQLERLWKSAPASQTASTQIPDWLKNVGQQLLHFLTGSQQLRIWTQDTKTGKVWRAYDPRNNQAFSSTSEQDLRVWLEQRHL